MAREIKFRAWDIQNERMVYDPDRFEPAYPVSEDQISPWVFYETWQDRDDGIRRNCQIMQFIGLLDKHKKEIFEGDILRTPKKDIKLIVYMEASFRARSVRDKTPTYAPHQTLTNSWEVIGNIYQHAHLISEKVS
jgi:hypothetical protein